MFRFLIGAAFCGALLATAPLATAPAWAKTFAETFPELADIEDSPEKKLLESLDYQKGDIPLRGGFAKLQVPEGYYFLGPNDAARVLTEAWGNPPLDAKPLGMLFPSGLTPYHSGNWGVEITWDPIGYVSDENADEIDYDDLLDTMQSDTRQANEWRRENGYESIKLIGWAAPPYYDRTARKLHWAKELEFGDRKDVHTLNYNMRVLGRKGVLVMNFIADMEQLGQVEAALPDVLAMASFNDGARYADFDPSIDTVAAVGIGGLIAGKALSKAGILAVLLVFLKKFWFIGVIAVAGLWKLVAGRSRG